MKLTSHDLPRRYWLKKAREMGLSERSFYSRIARGWNDEQAATTPPRRQHTGTSDAEISRAHGLRDDAVARYRRHHGDRDTPATEIAEHLVKHHTRKTLADKAREAGLNPVTVRDRIYRGWSEEKALSTPTQSAGSTIRANRNRNHGDALAPSVSDV